jgi:hypothetical protein
MFRSLLTLGFAGALTIGFATAAQAGGPTSVLLVVPGENRTAALYTGDPEYQELSSLLDVFNTATGTTTPPEGASDTGASGTDDISGPGVTLTWLIHDVSVWRVDRVYLNAKNGPWVSTQTAMDGGDVATKPATWRSVGKDGPALTALLDRLGVGTTGNQANTAQPTANPPVTANAPVTSASSDRASGLPGPDGVIWASLGVLLGAGLTLAAQRWAKNAKDVDAAFDADLPTGTVNAEDGQPQLETLSSHDG